MTTLRAEDFTDRVELRSWMEADPYSHGKLRLIGHYVTIVRRADGTIRDVEFGTTGVVAELPHTIGRKPTFFERLARMVSL